VDAVRGEEVSGIRAQLRLEPAAVSARQARRFVSEILRRWGQESLIDPTTLLVSELVTNAVVHARSEVELAVMKAAAADAALRVEVRDSSARQVRLGEFEAEALSGRGVALVDAVAARWGVEYAASGKLVWFELEPHLGTELNHRQAG
jgi:anti-sigma regulatory factor (Ser/Thr protein kinase)